MNKAEYKKMNDFEKEYWWHKGKRHVIDYLFKTFANTQNTLNILEVGCGTGEYTKLLEQKGNVLGIDISNEALNECKEKGIKYLKLGDISDMDVQPYSKKFDVILALDVLEHIQEDTNAMKNIREMLKPDGHFFINVPAHKFLWSEHDEALQHKRRYSKFELEEKLKQNNFSILKSTYFVSIVFPLIVAYRTWGNLFSRSAYPKTSYVKLPTFLNNLLTNFLKFETKLLSIGNIPMGTTIIVVAKRKE